MSRPSKADAGEVDQDSPGWRLNDLLTRVGMTARDLSAYIKELNRKTGGSVSQQMISGLRTNETEDPDPEKLDLLAGAFRALGLIWVTAEYIKSGRRDVYSDDLLNNLAHTYNMLIAGGVSPGDPRCADIVGVLRSAYTDRFRPSLGDDADVLQSVVEAAVQEKLRPGTAPTTQAVQQKRRR